MTICPVCSKRLSDEAVFCDNCGTQVVEQPQGAADLQDVSGETEVAYGNEEAELEYVPVQSEQKNSANVPAYIPPEITDDKPVKEKKKVFKKVPKKFIGIGIGIVAVVAAVFVLISAFGKSKSKNNYGLYIKDGNLYFAKASKYEPFQVSSKLFGKDNNAGIYRVDGATVMSRDGKTIFFPDKMDADEKGFSLFYRNVSSSKDEAVKIDGDVEKYFVNDIASTIIYLTTDGNLYSYSMKKGEANKIDSDVSFFYVSEDGKTIIYLNKDNTIYVKQNGKDKEKIDSDSSIRYISKNFSTIYYIKDGGDLYKKDLGADKIKIDTDVSSISAIYESGEIYYVKSDIRTVSLADYVIDDMKDADDKINEPESPSMMDYDTYDEYTSAYEKYEKAYDEYRGKRERDYLREELSNEETEITDSSLYFYDGKSTQTVTESFANIESLAAEKPVIIFAVHEDASIDKIKLSEIESISDLKNSVQKSLYTDVFGNIAIGKDVTKIEQDEVETICINADGNTIFFVDNVPEGKAYGDLYRMTVSGGKLQKAELYDSDVFTGSQGFIGNSNQYMYCKDFNEDKYTGDMYINKEKVDTDMYFGNMKYNIDSDTFAYFSDYDSKEETGTLKKYSKGKSIKISDDVHAFSILHNGDIMYLYDYSEKSSKGDLYVYSGKKGEKIDEDVSEVFYIKRTGEDLYGYDAWFEAE